MFVYSNQFVCTLNQLSIYPTSTFTLLAPHMMYKYLPTFPYFLSLVLGSLPHANSLQYVRQLGETASNIESSSGIIMDARVTIGVGLPLIPPKLVAKIESGEFVDMAELLPDRFGELPKVRLATNH